MNNTPPPIRSVYIAGPMTGIHRFNFPAFDSAAEQLRAAGWRVISPAELDRADGFDEANCTGHEALSDTQRQRFARNDIGALMQVDAIVLLPGWQQSTGATNEAKVASWLGLDAFEYEATDNDIAYTLTPVNLAHQWSSTPQKRNARADVLLGAERLVNGDRNAQYGDPRQDFERTARFWTEYIAGALERKANARGWSLGSSTGYAQVRDELVTAADVAALMALLKISRIAWSPNKQDSWMDLAGYAACGWDCVEATA